MEMMKRQPVHLDEDLVMDANISILLITNRDSDNVGDQVIEACDIALIQTAVKNLGFHENCLEIESVALSIVSNKYCETGNPDLLKKVYAAIQRSSFVLFGGAPVFNYVYQPFYKKTATIVNIAKELGKPVFFSAIGINDVYDENNVKSIFLREALHNGAVRRMTTRDGIEQLQQYAAISLPCEKYKGNEQESDTSKSAFPISLVSDPAVFARDVFMDRNSEKIVGGVRKKIGLFVFRAGGFSDNGIRFTRSEQCSLWRELCNQFDELGYDYELLTSGHFADEAVLQYMVDEGYVKKEKCVRNMNTPEQLVEKISSYSGVVSCRLHPSIISFSCNVPSVGLIWNSKVTDFYRHIGYPERAVSIDSLFVDNQISVTPIVYALGKAMEKGIKKDINYVESVYGSLVEGIAECIGVKNNIEIYSGKKLKDNIKPYSGTTLQMEREKLERKFARCYGKYNQNLIRLQAERSGIAVIDQVIYHSGGKCSDLDNNVFDVKSKNINYLASGNIEFVHGEKVLNNKIGKFIECAFLRKENHFKAWRVRFRIQNKWYWLLKDGGFYPRKTGNFHFADVFSPGEDFPIIPVRHINVMVAEAVWESPEYVIHYNSGHTMGECNIKYDNTIGTANKLKSGSVEFTPFLHIANTGKERLLSNGFSYKGEEFEGWRMRVKEHNIWYWILADGSYHPVSSYNEEKDCAYRKFVDEEVIPLFENREIESVVVEAMWRKKPGFWNKKRRFLF